MSRSFRLLTHKQTGDTIVEVVIAIAVIAVVLTGAFVLTSRNLTSVRDSQEHSEALALLQSQVEQLRNAAAQPHKLTTYVSSNETFCFNASGVIETPTLPSSPTPSPCTQNSSQLSGQPDSRYMLAINVCTSSSECQQSNSNFPSTPFLLTATWPGLNGGNDQVQITYRVVVD